jgi:uncharacterized protein
MYPRIQLGAPERTSRGDSRQTDCRMKINVAQQLKEAIGSVRDYVIDDVADTGYSIHGKIQLLRTNRSILVRGGLDTSERYVCSRCLEEFDNPLRLEIEEEFFLTRDPVSGLPVPAPNEIGAFTIGEDNSLDLGEAVRQYSLLAQPMKPICRDECKGLCSQCGRNLNHESCDCEPVRSDSPWAPLQGLIPSKKKRSDKERG